MKKRLSILFFALVVSVVPLTSAWSFLFEIPVLEQSQITGLSDKELTDKFIDVEVEMEAVKVFYTNSAFTPKEYDKYKALLKFRILLMQEMQKRKLEIPRIQP